MKKSRVVLRFIVAAVAAVMMFSLIGCNNNKKVDNSVEDTENLYIYAIEKGYGVEWINQLAAGFEAKYPGKNVHVETNPLQEMLLNTMMAGPQYNDYDLYFDVSGNSSALYDQYFDYFAEYEGQSGIYNMTEIYQAEIPGEGVTLESKLLDGVSEFIKLNRDDANGYYTFPWATSLMGLYYNIDVFQDAFGENWEGKIPNTTDELIDLCEELVRLGFTPFVYPGLLDYWMTSVLYTWWAQYEGLENYNNFYQGFTYNEFEKTWIRDKSVFEQQGRREALETLGTLLDQDKNFHPDYVNDYNANNFRTLQVRFLTRDQKIAMYPCGDWLVQESGDERSSPVAMMKLPVMSALADKLTSIDKSSPEASDRDLSEIIDYVDGTITEEQLSKEYSEPDIKIVREARSMALSKASITYAFTPAYSNAKALVKDFLLYMASDEGIRIVKEYTDGGFLPFKYDYDTTGFSELEMSMYNILQDATLIVNNPNDYIVQGFAYDDGTVDAMLGAKHDSSIYRTAYQLFTEAIPTDAEWQVILSNAGLGVN